jgi:hypothetical protein
VPLSRPVKDAFGVIDAGPLVLIDVETDQGVTGHSYIFACTRLTLKRFVPLIEEIGREPIGKPVAPFEREPISVVDAELVIEAPEYGGQHLRKVFRDQAGPRFACALAMHPDADAGGLERRHTLRQ